MAVPRKAEWYWWQAAPDAEPQVVAVGAVVMSVRRDPAGGTWGERIPDSDTLKAMREMAAACVGRCHATRAAEKWRFMAGELAKLHPSTEFAAMCTGVADALEREAMVREYSDHDYPWLRAQV